MAVMLRANRLGHIIRCSGIGRNLLGELNALQAMDPATAASDITVAQSIILKADTLAMFVSTVRSWPPSRES